MNMIPAKAKQVQGEWLLELADQEVKAPEKFIGKLQEGQQLTLGIRPNDIHLHEKQLEPSHVIAAKATFTDSELLGATMHVKAEFGGQNIIIEAPAEHSKLPNALDIFLDATFVHLFDGETQESLAKP